MIKNVFFLICLIFSNFFDCLLPAHNLIDDANIEFISMVYEMKEKDINRLMKLEQSYYHAHNLFFKNVKCLIKNKNNFLSISRNNKKSLCDLRFFYTDFNNTTKKDILKYALFLIHKDRIVTKKDLTMFIEEQKEKFKNSYYDQINNLIEERKIRIEKKLITVSDSLEFLNQEIVKSEYLIIQDAINNINLITNLIDENKFLTGIQVCNLFYNLGFLHCQLLRFFEALLYNVDPNVVFYMKVYLDVFKKKITMTTYDYLISFCARCYSSDYLVALYYKNKDFYNLLAKELKGISFVTPYWMRSCDNDVLPGLLLLRYDRLINLINKLIQKNFYVLKKYLQKPLVCDQIIDCADFLRIKNQRYAFQLLNKFSSLFDIEKIWSELEKATDEIAMEVLPLSTVNCDDIWFLTDKINNKNKEYYITKDIQAMLDSLNSYI
jgi:hypothetical protein